ncbi:MAG: DUF5458 family protein [Bacteroidia bacterium]|jgi:hypothetical protein|nr:DUF5458 family protein [Bacteroidia bacterium]
MEELQSQQPQQEERQRERMANPAEVLDKSCNTLAKFGGFDMLEAVIEGVQNMNPERKARKKIFLTETDKKKERESIRKALSLWAELLEKNGDVASMVEESQKSSEQSSVLLKKNLGKAIDATRDLERSYRSVALFYKNTEKDKLKNVTILNADPEQLRDLDNPRFIDAVGEELKANFDRLDLRDNYAMMVLPGYLGSNKVVEKWSKMAYENKVMMITDFQHLDNPDDVMELFEAANLTGGDVYRSNVMMTCNWLVGRGKYQEVGEEEDLHVPPSSALAGKIYSTLMSQVTAGRKNGTLNEVDGVTFDLKKSEIANLEKMGLVPLVNEYGKVMAFSAKTLFNGDNLGLQTYSVVRVFDYITKVLIDFLNRRAFENWNSKSEKELRAAVVKFLDSVTGPEKLIENFKIMRFEQDPMQKDRIFLDIHMTPYFPAKSFMIKMDGHKGDDPNSTEWNAQYDKA